MNVDTLDAALRMWLDGDAAAALGLVSHAPDEVAVLVGLHARVKADDVAQWRSLGLQARVGVATLEGSLGRAALSGLCQDPRVQRIEPAASVSIS